MYYQLRLDKFEGPFDLLLFLIQKDEIDIYDIPIASITSQFIEYVDSAEHINLMYAGEFIDMVATLMRIKTIMLLPRPVLDDESIEDPRTELVRRLIEYKRFKEAALELHEIEAEHEWIKPRNYFTYLKTYHHAMLEEDSSPLADLSLYDLIKAFRRVIDNIPKITEHQVKKITVSIEEQSTKIRRFLNQNKILYFSKLLEEGVDKIVAVVSFISILELTKAGEITLFQEDLFEDICIRKNLDFVGFVDEN